MRLKMALMGNLDKYMDEETLRIKKAVTTAVRRTASGIRNERNRMVRKQFGIKKAFGSVNYPKRGQSMSPSSVVYSQMKSKKYGEFLHGFVEGKTITVKKARWLVIPSEHVGRKGNKRLTLKDYERVKGISYIKINPKKSLIVMKEPGKKEPVLLFTLVKKVKMPQLFDFESSLQKWADKLPSTIVKELEKLDTKRGSHV